ncbi:FAD-dependent monooxygenase (plasmid) [Streptomyces sp. NBC_00536]|uniref:FAD-dependent monooxygenase n=1 Tax=Streptomyces sp. NBC_00536 TaxID=2975769 RepID=UPI002E813530|nr:FAD-dependent monooxygenase [Streptomyces sp. NBC_00536]WUC84277.1 FAD-dependent monooxygenase [Streptomyces sp. NBC_00536]
MPRSSGTGARVLIVGAGPAGLTAAHELARRGLRVRVVDAGGGPGRVGGGRGGGVPGRVSGGRGGGAVTLHPRTLEVFDQMGVVGPVLEQGRRNRAFTMTAGGGRPVRLDADYGSTPTRYPYTVLIEQARTEAVLRRAVARLGVRVEWGVRLTSLDQDEDGVRAHLEHLGGRREVCAVPWLVGCDGADSTVRARLRLPGVEGGVETWEMADAVVGGIAGGAAGGLVQDSVHWVHTGGQALLMIPHRRAGHWRLLDSAPADAVRDGRPVELRLSEKLSAGLGREVRVGVPLWSAVHTFRGAVATRMGEGRCFVAGDAAHVYGPASGQGLNTGVQDAYNLAWKLAMVEQGWTGRELLRTYEEERVPVARALLGAAQRTGVLAQVTNAMAGAALPAVMGVVRGTGLLHRAIQRKVLGDMSGLGQAYGGRPGGLGGGRRVVAEGIRGELRDVRWSLLYVPEGTGEAVEVAREAAGRYAGWLSVRAISGAGGGTGAGAGVGARSGVGPRALADPGGRVRGALALAAGGWLLVRPDGYTAGGGTELTEAELAGAVAPLGVGRVSRGRGAPAGRGVWAG